MSVKIRLQRHGRKQSPLYHIVIADARSPRDGSFIERIGTYNPMTRPATIDIDRMKAYEWMTNGAQPTETVRAILRFKGVLFYKHLQRGVTKGAMTPEDAEVKFNAWVEDKEARIAARVKASAEERKKKAAQISGTKKSARKKEVARDEDELINVDLEAAAAAETADDVVAEETATAEETAATETASTETATETAEETATETAEETETPAAEETTEAASEETDNKEA